ncbi:MAG: gamma-glutamyl phosphate reductase [actinobacterium acAMD-2]|nr:MAG: gamma-glutamyl phosphate reductase [actinobacterium acAMD-2]HAS07716.1 glutamate-5-semialdehyde dehydrogenase [Actinomycetota bacterium]
MTDSELLAIRQVCEQAREASFSLASTSRAVKDAALRTIADALEANASTIVTANATDLDRARADGTSDALIDRLTITPDRLKAIADALREVAELPDPIGEVIRGYTLPNGLQIRQLRVPLGVVGMIYEARPNVTVDAAGLCLKSGNAALLRGSSSAYDTNVALVAVMQDALEAAGLPRHAIQLVPGTSHESVKHLMQARGLVDVLIPRGGAGLIKSVVEGSLVPVIETGVGNCHVYVDADADIDKAINILINSKTQRVSVCNAAETLLVHADVAAEFLPKALVALKDKGVTIHGDAVMANFCSEVGIDFAPATEDDWFAEYYSLDLAAGVVKSIDEAISHIRRYTSGHTEAIVSDSFTATQYFVAQVDSAAVMVNASTRFTDGGEFGFGAEIGISTQKLHARGPMGLAELTSTKFVVTGDGHIRG